MEKIQRYFNLILLVLGGSYIIYEENMGNASLTLIAAVFFFMSLIEIYFRLTCNLFNRNNLSTRLFVFSIVGVVLSFSTLLYVILFLMPFYDSKPATVIFLIYSFLFITEDIIKARDNRENKLRKSV